MLDNLSIRLASSGLCAKGCIIGLFKFAAAFAKNLSIES